VELGRHLLRIRQLWHPTRMDETRGLNFSDSRVDQFFDQRDFFLRGDRFRRVLETVARYNIHYVNAITQARPCFPLECAAVRAETWQRFYFIKI